MTNRPGATELNAYVDGELSPERAARMAEAIARDRELAQEVAALLRLKTAAIAAFDMEPPALPEMRERASRYRMSRWSAAAAVVVIILAASVATLISRIPTDADRVLSVMSDWKEERNHPVRSRPDSAAAEAKSAGLAKLAHGLAALQLRVLKTHEVADGVAFDLLGPSGCRLAVWAGPEAANVAGSRAFESQIQSGSAVVWQAGGTQYLLVSQNAPQQKFSALAAALQQATKDAAPFDEKTFATVADARSQSSPCAT